MHLFSVGPHRVALPFIAAMVLLCASGTAAAQTLLLDNFEYDKKPLVQPNEPDPNMRELWHEGLGSDAYDSGMWSGSDGITTNDRHDGSRSFFITTTQGNAYFMFYPHDGTNWHNMREYRKENITNGVVKWSGTRPDWVYDRFNRMRFWVKVPKGITAQGDGNFNLQVGMYMRRKNGDGANAEDGGGHWYHLYNIPYTGEWHQVIIDTHPNHQRGGNGATEWGDRTYVTGESGYNYFDALTWFYVDFQGKLAQTPGTFYFDGFELFREDNANLNIGQIYSIDSVYIPSSNTVRVGWSRDKGMPGDATKQEVRYAYSDIYALGWDKATVAPNGTVSPNGYQGMTYTTNQINVSGRTNLYIAIKPQNASKFRQVIVPISGATSTPPSTSTVPNPPTEVRAN